MTHTEILNWGREHNFPFLVLDGDEPQKHGEFEWRRTMASGNVGRITRIVKRIEAWERIVSDVVEKNV